MFIYEFIIWYRFRVFAKWISRFREMSRSAISRFREMRNTKGFKSYPQLFGDYKLLKNGHDNKKLSTGGYDNGVDGGAYARFTRSVVEYHTVRSYFFSLYMPVMSNP